MISLPDSRLDAAACAVSCPLPIKQKVLRDRKRDYSEREKKRVATNHILSVWFISQILFTFNNPAETEFDCIIIISFSRPADIWLVSCNQSLFWGSSFLHFIIRLWLRGIGTFDMGCTDSCDPRPASPSNPDPLCAHPPSTERSNLEASQLLRLTLAPFAHCSRPRVCLRCRSFCLVSS
jgi:hypothetical protein